MGDFLLGDRRERTHLQLYFINSHKSHRWKNGWHKSAILRNSGETLWKRKRGLSILNKAVRAYFMMRSLYVTWPRVL